MNIFDVAGEDVAVEGDEVGGFAGFDGAGFIGDAQGFGGFAGKGGHGLGQRNGLIDVDGAVAVAAGGLTVGAGCAVGGGLAGDHAFDTQPGVENGEADGPVGAAGD